MAKVIRNMIGDFLGIGATPTYVLMGTGFVTINESPTAKVDKTPYVNNSSASGTITGYETVFPFDTQFIESEEAIAAIYEIARNQKTGSDAELYYVRADLFETPVSSAYPARRFKVAVEASSIEGNGNEIVRIKGNLHQVGDFTEGTFNPTTLAFTAAA